MIAIALAGVLIISWFNGPGLDRSPAIHRYLSLVMVGIGLVMAYHQDWWILALWVLVCANTLRFPWPMGQIVKLSTAGVLYLFLKTLQASITMDLVPFILYAILAVAFAQGILYFAHRRWSGNANHTDMLMVMGMASAVALGIMEYWGWFALAPIFLAPLILRPGQAYFWTLAPLIGGVLILDKPVATIIAGILAFAYIIKVGYSYRLTESGPDHGRIRIWCIMLNIWWHAGWKARLVGLGPDSWRSWADSFSKLEQQKTGKPGTGQFMSHPHNEYVHVCFEHGLVGLVLLLGWIGSLLWHAWQIQPALIIPGLTLCAIAFTCFPWTFPYEVGIDRKQSVEYIPFGCIGMVLVTAIIMAIL